MAADLYAAHALARDRFQQASEILGFALADVCFQGPESELVQTSRAQPALFVHSLIVWELWGAARPSFDFVAGHSLGEFSAVTASGALDFESGLRLVQARATAMQHACDRQPGTMAAITQLPPAKLDALLAEGTKAGLVVAANYNAEAQIVISGEQAAVDRVVKCAGDFGARRAVALKVGGAFHSPLMEPARAELKRALDGMTFRRPSCPVVMNVSALPQTDPDEIRRQLEAQIVSPVKWWQTMRCLGERGVDWAAEIGSGQVLKGLAKRILPEAEVVGLSTQADLERMTSPAQAAP
jgi:[acyl-carrier-protein] S-malonyltransferase